jgi:hypothetical protein
MKKISSAILFILTLLSSCLSLSNSEQMAIGSIVNTWGGTCNFSLLSEHNSDGDKRKSMVLELQHPYAFKKDGVSSEMVASNMAMVLYKSLTNEEKINYKGIKCIVVYETADEKNTSEFNYNMAQLKNEQINEKYFHYCSDALKERRFRSLFEHFDTVIMPQEKIGLASHSVDSIINSLQQKNGLIEKDSIISFGYTKLPYHKTDSVTILYYSGLLICKKSAIKVQFGIIPTRKIDERFLYIFGIYP